MLFICSMVILRPYRQEIIPCYTEKLYSIVENKIVHGQTIPSLKCKMTELVGWAGGGDGEKCFASHCTDTLLSFQLYCNILTTVTVLVCSVFV